MFTWFCSDPFTLSRDRSQRAIIRNAQKCSNLAFLGNHSKFAPNGTLSKIIALFSLGLIPGQRPGLLLVSKNSQGIWMDFKNDLHESFKMSSHLMCLSSHFNFHITSRPDVEAGHKRDIRFQLRHVKRGLILKPSVRPFSWHSPKSLRFFFPFRVSQPPSDHTSGD